MLGEGVSKCLVDPDQRRTFAERCSGEELERGAHGSSSRPSGLVRIRRKLVTFCCVKPKGARVFAAAWMLSGGWARGRWAWAGLVKGVQACSVMYNGRGDITTRSRQSRPPISHGTTTQHVQPWTTNAEGECRGWCGMVVVVFV